ncbi:MAG: insulinase family protein [Cytophagaceae bacterium]|jgi:predicted Zn-dependent peptidase|nr:insulinase family protein [Cytophagaceae bacterium]
MNKQIKISFILLLGILSACGTGSKYKTQTRVDANGYNYEEVTNDPFKARVYTLPNGLTVYLTRNTEQPRVAALVGVRAGSVNEDPEVTGLAHYLEHMMFKGTSKIGTTNWEAESALLQQISDLFEEHRATDDAAAKKAIYARIDSLSQIAATYVATNEFDKIYTALGASNTNAGTSYESTVYMCEIPKNEVERWAEVESERFSDLVLRLFHTELETIYEEFNMYQDRDGQRANEALMQLLFPTHPYGRDVIGLPEHLKSPSMKQIYDFIHKYYVPSNMAVALAGDLEFEETIKIVDKFFGKLEAATTHKIEQPRETPITAPVVKEVVGPEAENMMMAFRFDGGVGTRDDIMATLVDNLLVNGQAGLIDLNLNQAQKVQSAGAYTYSMKDYTVHVFEGTPRDGQTLDEVKDLLLNEIENIKNGNFDEWMIEAIVNRYRIAFMHRLEQPFSAAYTMMNAFISEQTLAELLAELDKIAKVTKAEVVEFAKANYGSNYALVYKRTGESKNLVKVDKPAITSIPVNRDLQSEFAKEILARETSSIEPVFVDFNESLNRKEIKPGVTLYHAANQINSIFTLNYVIDMGRNHNLMLPLAINYLPLIGTDKYSPEELQKLFFQYGLSFNVQSGYDRCYVTMSGLSEHFDKAVELLEHVMKNAKPDQAIYDEYVKTNEKERADAKKQQNYVFGAAIDYGRYGEQSPLKNIMPIAEMKTVDPKALTDLLAQITSYRHMVNYYGPQDISSVAAVLEKYHTMPDVLMELPEGKEFDIIAYDKPKVFMINYDINQANIFMFAKDQLFDKALMPYSTVFNSYFGSGLSSVVFQEIRESRSLAYSSYAAYSTAAKQGKYNSLLGFLGTQPDKLETATSALLGMMNTMPRAEAQFNMAIEGIIKNFNTERITGRSLFWSYLGNRDRGIDYDIRKDNYEKIKGMTIDDFETFFNAHISNKNYGYAVMGNLKAIDRKQLSKLGEIKELTLEEVFGY